MQISLFDAKEETFNQLIKKGQTNISINRRAADLEKLSLGFVVVEKFPLLAPFKTKKFSRFFFVLQTISDVISNMHKVKKICYQSQTAEQKKK